MTRPSWDEYHMNEAIKASTRSTCDRAHVGCAIVKDNHVRATGYNGAISKHDHCDDVGHIMVNDSCLRSAHAEENIIAFAAGEGIALAGSTAYVTHFPCWRCFRLLAQAKIAEIVFLEMKTNKMTPEIFDEILKSSIIIRSYTRGNLKNFSEEIKKTLTQG